jgi:hypothetical protein
MLQPILLAALLLPLPSQQLSVRCVDGGSDIAVSQTQPLLGPGGVVAVLKVSTTDDHGKNAHLCNADYQLLITPAEAGAARVLNLLTTDADWDRILSLRLDGFTPDGSRLFGVLMERGQYPSTMLFDYDIAGGKVQLIDLKKQFAQVLTARCNTTFDVVATTETTAIVIELNSARKPCTSNGLWLVDPTANTARRLPQGASFQSLFNKAYSGSLSVRN